GPYRPFHGIPTDENNARASTAACACMYGNGESSPKVGARVRIGGKVHRYFTIILRLVIGKKLNEKTRLFSQNQ
ncbi:hypothetical protein NQ370_27225, partial [Escherichia coli]|nr:hypothetical protein [Escherichia coli]